jgi:hypothetical protein
MTDRETPRARALPADITIEEIRRKQAARAAGLPLSATWTEIAAKAGNAALTDAERAAISQGAREERRVANKLEKQCQKEVSDLFTGFGGTVVTFSQPRATMQTEGIPDLKIFFRGRGVGLWWETKREIGGRLSSTQGDFAGWARECGELWGSGSAIEARAWLVAMRWAEWGPTGVLEPIRKSA